MTVLPETPLELPRPRKAAHRLKLTEDRIKALPTPCRAATYTYDTLAPHLAVRVSPGGTKCFVVVKKINGRPQRITLGRFPALRLDGARNAALTIAGEIATGKDPIEARRAARLRHATLEQVWADYLPFARARLRSSQQREHLWATYIAPKLGKVPLPEITRTSVQRLVNEIGATKPVQANRVHALLSVLLAYAMRADRIERNVASGIERFPETARSRILRADEVAPLLAAIKAEGQPWADLFQLLLYTGARRSAVAGMRWIDVDLIHGIWTIPANASKNKSPITVPLTQPAQQLLERRVEVRAGEPWVFPSHVGNRPIVGLAKAWRRILQRAQIADFRIHDVRRTVGTALARSGASPHLIAIGLGHRSLNSAKTYVRLAGEDARDALGHAVASLTSRG